MLQPRLRCRAVAGSRMFRTHLVTPSNINVSIILTPRGMTALYGDCMRQRPFRPYDNGCQHDLVLSSSNVAIAISANKSYIGVRRYHLVLGPLYLSLMYCNWSYP